MRSDKSKSACATCLFSRLVHPINQVNVPRCGCAKLSPLSDKEVASHLDRPNFTRGWAWRNQMYGQPLAESGRLTMHNAVIIEFPEVKSCHYWTERVPERDQNG